jgi:hypothetical protein
MANIVRAQVSIKGTRAIFWHHFGPDAIPLDKRAEKTGVAGNNPEEWRRTVLMTSDRQLYIDPTYIFGMCRDASRYTKKGRGSIQIAVCATLQIDEARILFTRDGAPLLVPPEPIPTDSDCSVYIDIRSVKNPSTKGRNVRYRVAASPGWETSFTLLFDKTIVSRAEMEAVMYDAGALVGLADGRSVGFGRFTVEMFCVD